MLGADWSLRAFSPQGQQQWDKPVPSFAWGVNVTGDGRLAVAAYGDGTIRWHRLATARSCWRCSCTRTTNAGWPGPRRATTWPRPGGEELIGWHVNRGWEQAADFFPASRFRERSLAGKALVFLDTCYAGQAMGPTSRGPDINALINDLSSAENGVVTYASSTGREVSQEDDSWGNGAFTKALIEGFGPGAKADLLGKGVITTATLHAWVSERVKELTRDSQHPVMVLPKTVQDFPMFVARR